MEELINVATLGSGFVGGAAGAAVYITRLENRVKNVEKALNRLEKVLDHITRVEVIGPRPGD